MVDKSCFSGRSHVRILNEADIRNSTHSRIEVGNVLVRHDVDAGFERSPVWVASESLGRLHSNEGRPDIRSA